MFDYVWLIPLLPMLAALWIAITYVAGWNRGEAGEKHTNLVILGASAMSFALVAGTTAQALQQGVPGQIVISPWLSSGDYHINISFTLDILGLAMASLVSLLSLISIRFSVNYLHREAGYQRFFMVMGLFISAMLLIVMAGSAALAFVGWELAGVSSFLLIGYAFDRQTATINANRAFVTNRIGDAGFIIGIFLAFDWAGGVEWPQIMTAGMQLGALPASLLVSGFVVAALAKSAQLPFSGWIARALEGPTPSSAVFYGALMVHAGVYLLIRLAPVLENAPTTMLIIAILGGLTALYGFFTGLVQTDVKSALVFSTTAQVGLMFMECGLGWFDIAAWHLVLHAMWRAYQFLSAPAVISLVSRPNRPVPQWLQKRSDLFTMALQRFWIDPAADALLVRPTQAMSRDLRTFDRQVVSRLVGIPVRSNAVASLADWEERRDGRIATESNIGTGQGIAGHIMEKLTDLFSWFEENLILKGGGEGLTSALHHLGGYLETVEKLLSQPRYLLLILLATFAVII